MKERKSGLPTALRVPFPGRHLRSCAEQARQLEAKQQKRSKKKKRVRMHERRAPRARGGQKRDAGRAAEGLPERTVWDDGADVGLLPALLPAVIYNHVHRRLLLYC